jgi:hypothetical protein
MPDNVYEVLAQAARYWFLFWMALIAWRSWRWYRKDRRAAKKRLKLLPDAGFVGAMVVVDGGEDIARGTVYPVPVEGTLGTARTNDLCVQADGVERRHLWFRFDDRKGLLVEPFGKNPVHVDGEDFQNRRHPLYMGHGSWLIVGGVQMRLRLFAGFESTGHANVRSGVELPQEPQPQQQPQYTQEQVQQMLFQQWQMQQAYQQGYQQAMAQQQAQYEAACEEPAQPEQPEWTYDEEPDALPFEMANIAREEGLVDNSIYMRPAGQRKPETPVQEPVFYPPEMDEEDEEEDWILEASDEPQKSDYVGQDEAEVMKREVWDQFFGGGNKR